MLLTPNSPSPGPWGEYRIASRLRAIQHEGPENPSICLLSSSPIYLVTWYFVNGRGRLNLRQRTDFEFKLMLHSQVSPCLCFSLPSVSILSGDNYGHPNPRLNLPIREDPFFQKADRR